MVYICKSHFVGLWFCVWKYYFPQEMWSNPVSLLPQGAYSYKCWNMKIFSKSKFILEILFKDESTQEIEVYRNVDCYICDQTRMQFRKVLAIIKGLVSQHCFCRTEDTCYATCILRPLISDNSGFNLPLCNKLADFLSAPLISKKHFTLWAN